MSIRKRADRWLVTVELGRDKSGRRRRHCSTHATESAALMDTRLRALTDR